MELNSSESGKEVTAFLSKYKQLYQLYLDRTTPHIKYRWICLAGLLAVFFLRIVFAQGWYVVCYGLGIFLLNQFLAFLTPKFDVSLQQDEENNELEAGERTDEFRPFIRRLPEFRFWHNATRATVVSLFLTLFNIFDIPVFWPILLMYFIILFALTMRRQIQHMIKYRYVPLDIGKKRYNNKK
ncbi:LAFE_0F10154g1_1 [Lachancea fermentati]|uniref:Protein RER1 n=1 Tax=Lachancea fermentati TaxID=4955 RepID=A0A1G4MFH5_LACFM|nr:LAFE_0F10154g1_1 [Lachancea fermentati]